MATVHSLLKKSVEVRPAQKGDTIALAVTTSSQWVQTPTSWLGKQMRFEADGGKVYYAFDGTTAPAVSETAVTTVIANVIQAPGGTECGLVPDQGFRDYTPKDDSHHGFFAFKGSAACILRIYPSSYDEVD